MAAPHRAPHRNHGARLRDYVWRGHRCISLENSTLRVVFCADKGSDLIELLHKPSDTELLYQHPRGLAHSHDRFATPLAGGLFRDVFPGGWYIMLPNGPEPCSYKGASYGHHGEATFLAFAVDILEDTAERVSVRFSARLRRTPLVIERTVSLTASAGTLTVDETVFNEAAKPIEMLWGHHPTFGGVFIEDCRVFVPPMTAATTNASPPSALLADGVTGVWPTLPRRDGHAPLDLSVGPCPEEVGHDFVRLTGFDTGWFAITNETLGAGVAVRWDETLFPLLGYWRVAGGEFAYPWWGSARMLALEPTCDLPSLEASAAAGTAIIIAGGEARSTRIEATVFAPSGPVVGVEWGGNIR